MPQVRGRELCGADHALKHSIFIEGGDGHICVARPGYTDRLREAMAAAKQSLINPNFVLVETEAVADVSSSGVRAALAEVRSGAAADDPSLACLHPDVKAYVADAGEGLYAFPATWSSSSSSSSGSSDHA